MVAGSSNRIVRACILVHRYVGIPMTVFFILWFFSGIVMMYTGGMPADSADERFARRSPIGFTDVALSPPEAARLAGIDPSSATLMQLQGRPTYRFGAGAGGDLIVFADDGNVFDGLSVEGGLDLVVQALAVDRGDVEFVETLHAPDQWTITERRHLPMHLYRVEGDDETMVYVSVASGEIILTLDGTDRLLAWAGAIPHWFYVTPLRTNQPTWYWAVVITSAVGCLVAALGLVLAFTQFRRFVPRSLGSSIRYGGLMRWHYYSGAVFGLFILTWVFSGLLSMDPFTWMNEPQRPVDRDALAGGAFDIEDYGFLEGETWNDVARRGRFAQVDMLPIGGQPYVAARRAHQPGVSLLLAPHTLSEVNDELDLAETVARAESAFGYPVSDATRLNTHDAYYYSRDNGRPLPAIRLKFADPYDTWLYLDARTGRIALQSHRFSRLDRWLFNGLHSLDFPFLYRSRPAWDVVLIVLSLGGIASSLLGLVLGARRIARASRGASG